MAKYRKKPVTIEATQWFKNGDHPLDQVGELLEDPLGQKPYERVEGAVVRYYRNPDDEGTRKCEHCSTTMHEHGWIDTLEGGHVVCPGDWIITGVQGELYPCKPDIFAATYDRVGDDEPEPISPAEARNLAESFMGGTIDADLLNSVVPKLEAIIGEEIG